ncbi:hypothetical protein MY3296_003433 [Beauveria thailandica]
MQRPTRLRLCWLLEETTPPRPSQHQPTNRTRRESSSFGDALEILGQQRRRDQIGAAETCMVAGSCKLYPCAAKDQATKNSDSSAATQNSQHYVNLWQYFLVESAARR